ncbi:MAG: hypothetical protein IK010_07810 [Bacteroidales bacterium]|nr:hypothetical protein [Bacteroidales bacterium]
MANTFISTDPDTKKQKTVKIPEGCIIIEMNAKEMRKFIIETFVGFLFVEKRERLQVFPKEVKTFDGIWRYVYPIRRGVAALMVNAEKWENLIEYIRQEKEKEEKNRLIHEDIESRWIELKNAKALIEISRGNLIRDLIDDYNLYFKHKKNNIIWDDELLYILEKYQIDTSAIKKNKDYKNYRSEIVGQIEITNNDRLKLLKKSIYILKRLLQKSKLKIGKDDNNYKAGILNVKRESLECLIDCYIEIDDNSNLMDTFLQLTKVGSSSDSFQSTEKILEYYVKKDDEDNLLLFANNNIEQYPFIYDTLINFYRHRGDTPKELYYIEKVIKKYPNEEGYLYKRLVELGVRKDEIIPPESHMDSKTIPVTSLAMIDSAYPCEWIEGGGYYAEGRRSEAMHNYKQAAYIFETLIANGYESSSPYDRLMIIYRKFKMIDDEIRIINLALEKYDNSQMKIVDIWRKRLETARRIIHQNN